MKRRENFIDQRKFKKKNYINILPLTVLKLRKNNNNKKKEIRNIFVHCIESAETFKKICISNLEEETWKVNQ